MNAPEEVRSGTVLRPSSKEPRRLLRPSSEWIAVPWTPIISEELFELAARQLQLNRERSPRRTSRYRYLLAGLLYCGYCRRRLCGHAGVASGRYECTRRRSAEPPESRCHLRSVSQRDIEPLVWEHVARLLGQPEVIIGYLREQQEGEGPEITDADRELKRLRSRKAALEREQQRLIDAYQVGAIELDELKDRRGRLREAGKQLGQREEALKAQLAQAERAATLQEAVTEFCERIGTRLVNPSFELKQQILRLVVEGIFVTDEEIVIQHIIPCEDTSRLYLRLRGSGEPAGRWRAGEELGDGPARPGRGGGGRRTLRAREAASGAGYRPARPALRPRQSSSRIVGQRPARHRAQEGALEEPDPSHRPLEAEVRRHRDQDSVDKRRRLDAFGKPAAAARPGPLKLRGDGREDPRPHRRGPHRREDRPRPHGGGLPRGAQQGGDSEELRPRRAPRARDKLPLRDAQGL